ncbi:hypothetical protein [Streptomyces sp. NPDC051636]|uniref:hypothetical protein n=1 Tax=Streptomyces sp. NPDC051636 TaxID=3365663 RepID=UPI003795FC14
MNLAASDRPVLIMFWAAGITLAVLIIAGLVQALRGTTADDVSNCFFGCLVALGGLVLLFAVALLIVWLAGGFEA